MEKSASTDKSLFPLGRVVMTRGVAERVHPNVIFNRLRRHANMDWGDVSAEDKMTNERALRQGERLVSAYEIGLDNKMLIITEADRSATTLPLSSEY